MRGTLLVMLAVSVAMGIIPAYAGNTEFADCTMAKYGDHPRVCGEHSMGRKRTHKRPGSSPRMRGTLVRLALGYDVLGIIPAYAGNTPFLGSFVIHYRDHPRVCGEH